MTADPFYRITGMALGDFAASHWDAAPLLRRGASLPGGGFDDLLSLAAVDELLGRRGVRTPFVRMSRDGELLAPSRFTRAGGAGAEIADQIADDKVLAEFARGATLVLQGLHRLWPPLQAFAGALAARLGHPVQVNAYVTPPQNTGFAPHYDVHDVFVLQFAGRKHWRIHEPVLVSPLRDQAWQQRRAAVAARAAEPPSIDAVLEPGDALYLPRGYVHAATSLGEISGHLTIGVHPVTRRSIVEGALGELATDVALRRSLPLGVDLADPSAIADDYDATIAALHRAIDRLDRAAIARGIGRHLATATRPEPLRPLDQATAAARLTPNDAVRLRAGLRVGRRLDGDSVAIELPDRELRFAPELTDAIAVATSGEPVTAAGLGVADEAAALELLAQLLRDGVVVPA